jgi:anti-sigma regulatory factor (Ser/Thr protein kinase)
MTDMLPNARTRLGNAKGDSPPIGVTDLRYAGIPATAAQLPRIRRALTAWAHQVGVSADDVDALVLATYEAMANVIIHAYPYHQGTFDVHAAYSPDQRSVNVTVSDRGRWRAPPSVPAPPHGMGLQLIQGLATDVTVDPGAQGTTVRMRWLVPSDSPRR